MNSKLYTTTFFILLLHTLTPLKPPKALSPASLVRAAGILQAYLQVPPCQQAETEMVLLIFLHAEGHSSKLRWKFLSLAGPHVLLSSSVSIGCFIKYSQ